MNRKTAYLLGPFLGLVLLIAALWYLHCALSEYHYKDLAADARAIPSLRLIVSMILTALNYFVLTGYDALAFR
jgi:hypothetical protein